MEQKDEQGDLPPTDPSTRLRIVSVELNNATAELHQARHEVLYRRLRMIPARRGMPAWGAALIVGGIGAAIGAIPAMLVRGDNVLFVFVAVCAAYTILAPATMLLLADRDGENDLNRRERREATLSAAIKARDAAQSRVDRLHEEHAEARRALRETRESVEQAARLRDPPAAGGAANTGSVDRR
ncbi:MAG TPA: hypothetical protein VL282_06565 [Tepidisphaeraceae bacterium]|jgi:hypothetical protein|nr:hypothetical protein [Tepidisphaeraceae bacterium]